MSPSEPRSIRRLSVIVPTRNEAGNVRPLVERVAASLKGISHEIIFVDDSDDETPARICQLARAYRSVRLLHRERGRGLASAVALGFARARGRYVAVLDGDLQHPPELLPVLLQHAEEGGLDLVVASRYVRGGRADGLEGLHRRAVSWGSRWVAQLLVPAAGATTDPLSGYFLVRRAIVLGVELRPRGFKILLEVLARAQPRRVSDVPYQFQPRLAERSKASLVEGLSYLRHLIELAQVA